MDKSNHSLLADLLSGRKRNMSGMKEGKKRLETLFLALEDCIKPGMTFDRIKKICETHLIPYEEALIQIIPEYLPYHNECTDLVAEKGQLLTVDCAVKVKSDWADGAITFGVGCVDKPRKELLSCSKHIFELARSLSEPDTHFIETVKQIDLFLGSSECFLVRNCGGHGIGKRLHQGNEYIYSDFSTTLVYPINQSYTVEPVIGIAVKGKNIYSYFEETIIND